MEQGRNSLFDFRPASVAYTYSILGRQDDAERLAREAIEAGSGSDAVSVGAYLALGDLGAALQRLERAAERAERHEPDPQFYGVAGLNTNHMRDPVLERPEFAAVLARIRGD
jgi:hypothetical protein